MYYKQLLIPHSLVNLQTLSLHTVSSCMQTNIASKLNFLEHVTVYSTSALLKS